MFPARPALLVVSVSPCPCGGYGAKDGVCTCSDSLFQHYQQEIAKCPLVDYFDIQVEVRLVTPEETLSAGNGISSERLEGGVMKARIFSLWRKRSEGEAKSLPKLLASCHLDKNVHSFMLNIAKQHNLNSKSIAQILIVARTIADLEESLEVKIDHIMEAYALRVYFQSEEFQRFQLTVQSLDRKRNPLSEEGLRHFIVSINKNLHPLSIDAKQKRVSHFQNLPVASNKMFLIDCP